MALEVDHESATLSFSAGVLEVADYLNPLTYIMHTEGSEYSKNYDMLDLPDNFSPIEETAKE
ncbi:hypothetical protein [Bacterioplanoides sp.]|uniref:hypothetical protein n=1 Tax=Bacterioplanoides sp. TaxID=2066072 RepID=UPI003B59FE2B